MIINILCENHTGTHLPKQCTAEWGLPFFIQEQGLNILFDTGHTGAFIKNALAMGLAAEIVDYIVLSHHHWDHINGLFRHSFESRKKLILHPDILNNITPNEKEYLLSHFDIISSQSPYYLRSDIIFLGEIPRVIHFEKGTYKDLPMNDDSALVIITKKGLVVISGCSHC